MRRIAAVLGVLILLLGVRLYEVQPSDCGYAGQATEYACSRRFDFFGDEECALEAVKNLGGKVLYSEKLDCGVTVFYAYTTRAYDSVSLGGKKVNIMVAVSDGKVSVGIPMLEGSY